MSSEQQEIAKFVRMIDSDYLVFYGGIQTRLYISDGNVYLGDKQIPMPTNTSICDWLEKWLLGCLFVLVEDCKTIDELDFYKDYI